MSSSDTVLVPREATEAMIEAGVLAHGRSVGFPETNGERMVRAYAAMLAASPQQSPISGEGAEPVGAAEREVGRAVYERIEHLIGGNSPELSYLAELTESVEEYGSYSGPTTPFVLGSAEAELVEALRTITDVLGAPVLDRDAVEPSYRRARSALAKYAPPVPSVLVGEGQGSSLRDTHRAAETAVLATDLALVNDLIYTHGGDAALAGWVRICGALPHYRAPGFGTLHPSTADLVDRFAKAMKEKLEKAEAKYGYSDGWLADDWHDDLVRDLAAHVQKGDPRDVAAYCAFAWHHGWPTTTASAGGDEAKRSEPEAVSGEGGR